MAFHLFLPQMRMTQPAIVERAQAAEAAGFEGIAFMDHLAPPLALEHDMWEAMSIAGWVLAHTTTLAVGHLVLCDALRHPAVLARQAVSLDHASNGRFELGIGWGSVPAELETFGVGSPDARQRVGRLAESIDIIRRLWSGEVVDHDGDHFRLVGAQQRPVPTRPIPITIGGVGARTLALVRDHADWWNVPVHELDRLDDLRDRAGTRPRLRAAHGGPRAVGCRSFLRWPRRCNAASDARRSERASSWGPRPRSSSTCGSSRLAASSASTSGSPTSPPSTHSNTSPT